MGLFRKKQPKQALKTVQASPPPPKGASLFPPLGKILKPELVLIVPGPSDKYTLVELLIRRLCQSHPSLEPDALLNKVMEREQGLSTTLDTGLSIPHARLAGLKEVLACLAILPKGIQDMSQAGILIRAVLVFFSPDGSQFFQPHLQFLKSVSTLFQPAFIDDLVSCSASQQVLDLLKKAESH